MTWGAKPVGWKDKWPPADACAAIAAQVFITHPANAKKILRWQQTAVSSSTAFGAGGSNIQVAGPNGAALSTQVTPIPDNLRSWLIRNGSATKNILYWTKESKGAPANEYETLAATGVIAHDEQIDFLYFMCDPASTDASVEVEFDYYDPSKP